jgi:hypothetical protein
MEDTIKVALARWRDRQPNMASESFRNNLAEEIALLLREKGTYTEYGDAEIEEQKAKETWVCSICGKNTFDVDYDYLGSGTNHLGCELAEGFQVITGDSDTDELLEIERQNQEHREPPYNSFVRNKEELKKSNDYVYSGDMPSRLVDDAGVDIKTGKYVGDNIPEGMRRAEELAQEGLEEGIRAKNWLQKKHEDKVFGHDQGGNYIVPASEEIDGMYTDEEVKGWEEAVGYVEPDNDTDVELRDKIFEKQKHEFYENTQKQLYTEMTSDGLPEGGDAQAVKESHRLAEELVDSPTGYIYESPDGGETIYQRKVGESKKTKLTNEEWKEIKNEKK